MNIHHYVDHFPRVSPSENPLLKISSMNDDIWPENLYWFSGWWLYLPLWKILVIWDDDIPNIWKNKKCSKPPTSQKIYGLVLYWWIFISPWKYPQYPQSFMTRDPEYKYWGYRFIMIYPLGIPLAMIWLWPWKKPQNDRIMANLCQIPCKKINNILSWWT